MTRGSLLWILAAFAIGHSALKEKSSVGIESLVGVYKYKKSSLFKDGQELDIAKIYKPLSLEITKDSTLICKIKEASKSEITVGRGKIQQLSDVNGERFWIAKWEDMNYSVRTVFWLSGKGLKYEIAFDNQTDAMRYGMKEVSDLSK